MSNVSLDLEPRHYLGPQTANWVISDQVDRLSFTENGPQPTISEYIAYDTLSPPNPFIAVTQDGRGNVVYDGGFPKFYNMYAPAAGVSSFSGLSGTHKYFYNALNWVANTSKTAVGNRKVLLLGDKTSSPSYWVKDTTNNTGFSTTLTRLANIANFQLTIKDPSDYGGVLNPTLSELEQYVAVVYIASQNVNGPSYLSNQAVTNLVTYRENGNGLIMVCDHGPDFNDIVSASSHSSPDFIASANKLVSNFGAYFTGFHDRTPVNVGFLRTTYGDHPLYSGLLDSEDVYAGGSESAVRVASYPTFTKVDVPALSMDSAGQYTFSVLAILKDGSTETYRFVYSIIEGEILRFKNSSNQYITETEPSFGHTVDFNIAVEGQNLGTLRGDVLKSGAQVGNFQFDEVNGLRVNWFAGNGETVSINNGDLIEARIHTPFEYTSTLITRRHEAPLANVFSKARTLRLMRDRNLVNGQPGENIPEIFQVLDTNVPNLNPALKLNPLTNLAFIRRYFTNQLDLPDTTANIYSSDVDVQNAFTSVDKTQVIIDVNNVRVYQYVNEQWRLVENTHPKDFLGSPRKVTNPVTGKAFFLEPTGTIRKVN